jgi:hypothetical protein
MVSHEQYDQDNSYSSLGIEYITPISSGTSSHIKYKLVIYDKLTLNTLVTVCFFRH